nr:hypothetical protein [Neorhizobium tomejilense]
MADGADVRIDGELVIEMKPIAHCYDGDTYEKDDVYRRILQHYGRWTTVTDEAELRQQIVQLGHEVSEA